DITTGSPNVIVAVIDTGVLLSHPDLQGKLVPGFDFIADPNIALDGSGIDSNPDDPGDQSSSGSSFHGTHVAGIVAAATNNGSGVAGSGWDTRIMPLRVLGRGGSGSDFDIEQALRFAAGLPNDSGTVPTQRADVINMSLGGTSISGTFQGVVNQVRNNGVIIVAASGNDGGAITHFPASLNGVISVSAVTIARQRAFYSNFNNAVDIAAPGGDNGDLNGDGVIDGVVSTLGDDRQGSIRFISAPSFGTSMATPHVAGVIALMKAVNSRLSPSDVDSLLSNGMMTTELGPSGRDNEFGHGLLDAHEAVLSSLNMSGGAPAPVVPAQLSVSPEGLNFGANIDQLVVNVGNAGGGSLRLDRVTEDSGGFVNVVRNEVDGNGLGTYIITVNRDRSPGTYSANIGFASSANTVTLPIIWQVPESGVSTAGDAGRLFVLLVDPGDPSAQPFQQAIVDANNGRYSFRFDGVEPGNYFIVAGSDNNNDTQICDPGDSCGAFLTVDRPSPLRISNTGFTGVDFTVNFNNNFLSTSNASSTLGGRTVYRRLGLKQVAR
ncbi:MAG: S8 family peptidase, partial [Pseudomonadota bacterium]